ncbi:ArsR/SmtB family transcription factor [Sciscionella marina]|uniref:ArsR/SmtB family transcription factor n=1 Tax=Sciscionella marina TaxID=508770 RepID=UPI00036FF626|nr:helix-turn-helix domain-containing protein [Sciscionella marina]
MQARRRQTVLRIHFTPEDVLRTRLLAAPDPMWELVLSSHRLRKPAQCPAHARWRGMVTGALADERTRTSLRILTHLIPDAGNFPDFLTPYPSLTPHPETTDFAAELETVLATPRGVLARDMHPDRLGRNTGGFGRAIAESDRAAIDELSTALRHYFHTFVRPYWADIGATITQNAERHGRRQLSGGTEALLGDLGPTFRWNWPVLETDYVRDRELHLGGRGLLLVPSYFCRGTPVTMIDAERRPVLTFPAVHSPTAPSPVAPSPVAPSPVAHAAIERGAHLDGILGTTRARILYTLQEQHSTSALAEAIELSAASASQQVTLLREAGLVSSRRTGQSVLHSITPRGRMLLSRP